MKKCSPKGRDCIEMNSALTFNCSTNCEGIYADVQWHEESVADKEMVGKREEELDMKKYRRLVSEYRQYKMRVVRHFRFNETTLPDFGMCQSQYCSIVMISYNIRRRASSFDSSAGADLL